MRQAWLDWQRGMAVLFMIEVHVLEGWLAPGTPGGGLHDALKFIGGLAAPGFLFMAGVSFYLGDAAQASRGVSVEIRRGTALRRALWVIGVAYAFRVGEFVLGGAFLVRGGWLGILQVDILNVIGAALVLATFLYVRSGPRRLFVAAAAAGLVLSMPFLASLPDWAHLGGYVVQRGGYGFSLANWGAFLLLGVLVAPWLLRGFATSVAIAGVALGAGLLWGRLIPAYGAGSFWVTSPAWFLERFGATLGLTAVLQLVAKTGARLEPLSLLGRHSLFAYMVSVELTYGLSTGRFHKALDLDHVLLSIAAMTAVTWFLVWMLERLPRRRAQKAPV